MLQSLVCPSTIPNEVPIYFGSQSGTAEKLSQVLEEEAHSIGVKGAKVLDFNNFDKEAFPKHELVLCCIATHYEGDPCDNTRDFFKWVKGLLKEEKANPTKPFSGMKFAIFGLGDTSYELYQEMAKYFDKAFETLGAARVFKMGEGNSETFSTEDDFDEWKMTLWQDIFKVYAEMETPEQAQLSL